MRQLERATQFSDMASNLAVIGIEEGLPNCVMSVQGKQC